MAVTSSALVASIFSYQFTTNMWVGVLVALAVALAVGFINGVPEEEEKPAFALGR